MQKIQLKQKIEKDSLFSVPKSFIDVEPTIKKIIPITISPTTKANVSKMTIASSEGLPLNASLTSIILNSGEKQRKK